ncbi:hypothetical protein JCM17823_00310 [Halorubrum gandharaense]
MAMQRLSEIVWRYYSNSKYRRAVKFGFLVVLGIIWFGLQTALGFVPLTETVLIVMLLLLVSQEALESEVHRIGNWVLDRVMLAEKHSEVAEQSDILDVEPGEDVYILCYDGISSYLRQAIDTTAGNGARVFLLFQHPDHLFEDQDQKPVISTLQFLHMYAPEYDIRIRFFEEPASMLGIKTDRGVSVGWYTYSNSGHESGRQPIEGPRNPAIVASREDEHNFPIADGFFSDVFRDHYLNGRSLRDLCESDDCPDALREWLESGGEMERESRAEWIEEVSGPDDELPLEPKK